MFKFLKRLFGKQKVEPAQPEKDPLERKLQKERTKKRKIAHSNRKTRIKALGANYRWKSHKKHRKTYYPQDATKSWYYQTYLKDKEGDK